MPSTDVKARGPLKVEVYGEGTSCTEIRKVNFILFLDRGLTLIVKLRNLIFSRPINRSEAIS